MFQKTETRLSKKIKELTTETESLVSKNAHYARSVNNLNYKLD